MVAKEINTLQDYIVEILGTAFLFWLLYQISLNGTTWTRLAGLAVALAMMGYKRIAEIAGEALN